jgi:DNA-binding MarR family transcriptional regulator
MSELDTPADAEAELGLTAADRYAALPHTLQRHVGVLLIRVAAMVKQRIEEGMQQCGLRPRHYAILQLLRTEGAVSQQAVGARLDIDPGTVVDLIDVLEERGLVERRRRVGDRRVYELHLTAAGADMSEQIEPVLASVEGTALAPLSAAEMELLKDMLARVVTQPR